MTGPSEVFFGREAGRRAPPSVRPLSPGQALSHVPASSPALRGKYIQPTVGNGDGSAWVLGLGWVILWTNHGASLHVGFCGWKMEIHIVPPSEPGSGTGRSAGVKSMLSWGQAWSLSQLSNKHQLADARREIGVDESFASSDPVSASFPCCWETQMIISTLQACEN